MFLDKCDADDDNFIHSISLLLRIKNDVQFVAVDAAGVDNIQIKVLVSSRDVVDDNKAKFCLIIWKRKK